MSKTREQLRDELADKFCVGHYALSDERHTRDSFNSGFNAADANPPDYVAQLVETLKFISNGCLVPPDGGSPRHPEDSIAAANEALANYRAAVKGRVAK